MSKLELVKTRIQAGIWEGILIVPESENTQPDLQVTHLNEALEGVQVEEDRNQPRRFGVRVPISAELLSDGVQTFLISDVKSGDRLASFTIVTGQPLEDDIRAEVDMLRAELDMLKRVFRRHSLEQT